MQHLMSDRWDLHSPVCSFLVPCFLSFTSFECPEHQPFIQMSTVAPLGDMAEMILNDSYSLDLRIHTLYILISTHLSVILKEYLILFAGSVS